MMFVPFAMPPQPPVLVQAEQPGASVDETLSRRAQGDGWSASQAEWIGKIGAAAMAKDASTPAATLDEAYKAARRILTIGYFDNVLAQGKSRLVAFLTVVDLEKQVAQRAGGPVPDYPDASLKAAYVELAKAAERGASSAEQIEIGFAALRASAK